MGVQIGPYTESFHGTTSVQDHTLSSSGHSPTSESVARPIVISFVSQFLGLMQFFHFSIFRLLSCIACKAVSRGVGKTLVGTVFQLPIFNLPVCWSASVNE